MASTSTATAPAHTAMEDFAEARKSMPFQRQNGWYTAGVPSIGPGGGNQQFSREQLAQISSEDRKRIIAEYEEKMKPQPGGAEQWMTRGNLASSVARGVGKLFKKKSKTDIAGQSGSDGNSLRTVDSDTTKVEAGVAAK